MTDGRRGPQGFRLLTAVLGTLALTGAPASGQGTDLPARVRARMQAFVDQKEVAGAVTLVGTRDRVVSLVAVGRRDIAANLPMLPDTLFRIASMTKPVTAIAVMMLADAGKLSVDDPVEKHLPEFRGQMMVTAREGGTIMLKKPARPITLRDVLTHTSGLPGSPPPGLADPGTRPAFSLAEGVAAFSQRPLDFEPGRKWAYSNTGFDTLGRVVEVVSGQSYESFLEGRIIGPLGMADTTFDPSPVQLRRSAVAYERVDGELRPVSASKVGPSPGARYSIPAGGLYATAPDLAKLYQMMLRRGTVDGQRLLSESSVDAMTRLQTGDLAAGFTDGMGFGLGWGVVRTPTGIIAMLSPGSYGHGGGIGTQAWIDPKRGRFAILMIQRAGLRNADASEIRQELQRIAFGEPES
jgi:CubicO group peptidase (beta-lactamase class C family)